jgi:uncharacterized protein (DUF2147 family)
MWPGALRQGSEGHRQQRDGGGGPATNKPPEVGLTILTDFTAGADGIWRGHIFKRQNGQTYDCLMALSAPDELTVTPYVGAPADGRPQVWKRVAADSR